MAGQPSNEAVQQQQARQEALTTLLTAALARAWGLIDLNNLNATLPEYQHTVAGLVRKFGQSSAVLAADFYRTQRAAAGVAGKFTPTPADPAGLQQVRTSLSWATRGLWKAPTGEPAPPPATRPVAPAVPEIPAHVANAQTLTNGAAQKMVLDTGRNTLIQAIEQDRKARGWARQPRPTCCYFCAMLATRGAVYKTEQTADFQAHDHDHCVPVPLFSGSYEAPDHVRQWQDLYTESTKGRSSADAGAAFRQAFEGRAVTGSTGRRGTAAGRAAEAFTISPEQAKKALYDMENALPGMRAKNHGGILDGSIAWTERRITELRKIAG